MGSKTIIRAVWALAVGVGYQSAFAQGPLTGYTFASEPGALYVSVRDLGKQTGLPVDYDEKKNVVLLGGKPLTKVRHLPTKTSIVRVSELKDLGANLTWDDPSQTAGVQIGTNKFEIKRGPKKVIVDQAKQTLIAYQGDAIVMETHVSTGREGHHTPNGSFSAGPTKERIHYSHLYDEAPMPYSVQVDGNVFIHGFSSVPRRPASHGCVRMPLGHGNPARYFYEWVDVGTPVTIQGQWSEPVSSGRRHRRRAVASRKRHRMSVVPKAAPAAPVEDASSTGPQAVPIR